MELFFEQLLINNLETWSSVDLKGVVHVAILHDGV